MKGKICALVASVLLAGPMSAMASPGYTPVDFLGTLDVTCLGYSAAQCGTGGVLAITGSVSASGIVDFGTAANPTFFTGTLFGTGAINGLGTSLDGSVDDVAFLHTSGPATNSILGDWLGVGTPVVIASGDNGALRIADLVIASTTNVAPEIDPASAAAGLALLAGMVVILRGRRPQRLTA